MRLNFTTIRTFPSVAEASVACSMLQADGVNAHVYNEELVIMNWLNAIAYGGVKLVVPEMEVANAVEILENNSSIPLSIDDSDLVRQDDYFNQFEPFTGAKSGVGFRKAVLIFLLYCSTSRFAVLFLLFFAISPMTSFWSSKAGKLETMKFLVLIFVTGVISAFLIREFFFLTYRWL